VISSSAARAVNHLLQQQPWASERLARHAGMSIEIAAPPLPPARLAILESGLLAASAAAEADLRLTVNPLALPLFVARRQAALPYLQIAGPEDLAATIRQLAAELQWDFEEDLSRLVGDAPAHRAVEAGRDALLWQRDAGERLARNFSEYWTEERPLLARRMDLEALARDVEALQASTEALTRRLPGA
jgi:ubiquinone biosynthesis protein UbiJ